MASKASTKVTSLPCEISNSLRRCRVRLEPLFISRFPALPARAQLTYVRARSSCAQMGPVRQEFGRSSAAGLTGLSSADVAGKR